MTDAWDTFVGVRASASIPSAGVAGRSDRVLRTVTSIWLRGGLDWMAGSWQGPPMLLSENLRDQLAAGFFRPLARPSWPIYVDAADRLLESADDGGQISREEGLALIRDVVMAHPELALEADEGAGYSDARQKAQQLFNRMLESGWLHQRVMALGDYQVLVTPALRWTVRLLRELARNDPAELQDFAATLRSLCRDLLEPPALNPESLEPEAMRQVVRDLLDRATHAGDQMHAVEALILRAENAQRGSGSAAETLERFLIDFHAGDHMVCYDALQEGGLVPRLQAARRVVQEAGASALAKDRLAGGLIGKGGGSEELAYAEAEGLLKSLERAVAAIPSKQRIIDGRMADFSRLSAQRYRYQTEMRGRRPEQVKAYMDGAARAHAGRRFADLEREEGLPLLCVHVAVRFGVGSLAPGRKARMSVRLDLDKPTEGGEESSLEAQEAIRRHNLHRIAPQRALRFLENRVTAADGRLSTEDVGDVPEDDWLDLLAVLAFDRAQAPGTRRAVRWKIHSARRDGGLTPSAIPVDRVAGNEVERVIIERLS